MTNAELVEKIRRILEDPESASGEEQQEAARLYATRLRRVDDEFRRALGRVNSGEYSDADRILTDGAALEEYASLLLPGAEAWQIVCRTFDYDVAPAPDQNVRDRLAAFRQMYDGVRDAFAHRRRLAMENAPLRAQLETLYYIEEKIGAQVFLNQQIEALEERRNAELVAIAKEINQDNVFSFDFNAIVAELTDSRRHTPVPNETIESFRVWVEYVRGVNEINNLRSLIARWQAAADSQDQSHVLACLAEYRNGEFSRAAAFVTTDETNQLTILVDYALKVERQHALANEARRKIEALRSALLRANADADKLHDLFEAATIAADNAGTMVPPDVESDCRKQIAAHAIQSRRRRIAMVTFSLVAVAFFGTLATLSILRTRTVRDSRAAADAIMTQLDSFERRESDSAAALAAVSSLVDRYANERPNFNRVPEYSAAVERFASLDSAEKERIAEIETLVDEIDDAHEKGNSNSSAVERLKKLLLNDREKERYDYARRYREDNNLANAKNSANTDRYSELIDDLTAKASQLVTDSDLPVADAKQLLREVQTGLDDLKMQESLATIAAPLVNARAALEASVVGSARRLKFREALDKHGAALVKAIGNDSSYIRALKTIRNDTKSLSENSVEGSEEETEEALNVALDAALEDVENAAGAAAWNRFSSSWGSVNETAQSLSASNSAAVAMKAMRLDFAPEFSDYKKAREALDRFAQRGGYDAAAKALLAGFRKYHIPTWVVYDRENERYFYLTSDPANGRSRLSYLADSDGSVREFVADEIDESAFASVTPSVQSMLSQRIEETLGAAPTPEGWIDFVELAIQTLDSAPETTLDPVVKLQLIAFVVDSANSYPGFDAAARWLEQVRKDKDFDFAVNAYQPGAALLEQREAARRALRDAPDFRQASASARAAFDDGERSYVSEYRWVGYLDVVDAGATLVLGVEKSVPDGASLWIARGKDATAEQIGVMEGEIATFSSKKDWTNFRWTPVYARVAK
ncbi:MAG: hypothetical protein ACOX0A_07905 [Thermoguttaceae bacterium]|jgi:hypothetical protein